MVRLADLKPAQQQNLEALDCPTFDKPTVLPPAALSQSRVALISTAGLMARTEDNVAGSAADYRTIDNTTSDTDVLMNHISINFDRSGFAEDINCALPRERLQELADNGVIAHAASQHYAFMGATAPDAMKPHVQTLVAELKSQNINTVCLLPV